MNRTALKALIIDSDPELGERMARYLQAGWPGVRVAMADSADASAAAAVKADVILLDQQRDTEGFDLLRLLKLEAPDVPVVYLTASNDERLVARVFGAGADDYLPRRWINSDRLLRAVRETLRQSDRSFASTWPQGLDVSAADCPRDIGLKGFAIERRLHQGALSSVYEAYDLSLRRRVALKILHSLAGEDEHETLQRFLREYQTVSRIIHPNIVKIYDVGVADEQIFISMEYLPGGSLRDRLRDGALAAAEALARCVEINDALGAIHAAGILHRDLKPGNVLLREDGSACLIDFGLAKLLRVRQELTIPGRIYGTPYYMSPEQGRGDEVDQRSDIYSLGVMFHEMLSGRKPYLASTPVALIFKHAHAPLPTLPASQAALTRVIHSLMAKDPAQRPAGHAAVRDILTACKDCKILR